MKQRILLVAAFLVCLGAQAQEGAISGVVTDPSGAVTPEAEVTITNTGTGQVRTAKTSDQGHYVVPSLRPGEYSLRVRAPGFKIYSRNRHHLGGRPAPGRER